VLARLDDAEFRTLAATSLLPQVDVDMLDALGLGESAVKALERLRRLHSFVTRLDRQTPTWRLHDLLRDALRTRFNSIGDARWRRSMRSAAAGVAADRGLAREAVQLHLDAGDTDAAGASAELFARELVKSQRLAELDSVVGALDPAIVDRSMPLQIALGESATKRNNARAAVFRFGRAMELLGGTDPSPVGLVIAASALGAILEGWQDYSGVELWAAHVAPHLRMRDAVRDINEGLRIDTVCLRSADVLWGASLGDRDLLISS
jgi:ATP/maltotriose-dependent transcriptional regulator MalT